MKNPTQLSMAVIVRLATLLTVLATALLHASPANALVMYQAQISSMELSAAGATGQLAFHLDSGQASTGMLGVAPDSTAGDINPGNGKATVVGSFFDIFAELEPMNCSPNCPDKTKVKEKIEPSGSCETTFANFFDVFPPDCPYVDDQSFSIEDVVALITEFLFELSLPTVVPHPGWDFALVMATVLDIQTDTARGYRFVGETVIDFRRVPEPGTMLLVLLGLVAATVARRRPHHLVLTNAGAV